MTNELEAIARSRLEEGVELSRRLLESQCVSAALGAARMISQALHEGGKVLLFGNGGSAAEAQHLAAELVGRFRLDRRPLPALALTTNSSSLLAIANDMSFADVFSRQVEGFGQVGDVVVGLSTSGESQNVVEALRCARRLQIRTIAMTGQQATEMSREADLWVAVPSTDTSLVQEGHLALGHAICELVELDLSR